PEFELNISRPAISIRPVSGVSRPAMARSVVVLPQPDGPNSVNNSPSRKPKLAPNTPPPGLPSKLTYCFLRFSTCSTVRPPAHCVPLTQDVMARNSGPSRRKNLIRRADARRLDGSVKAGHDTAEEESRNHQRKYLLNRAPASSRDWNISSGVNTV